MSKNIVICCDGTNNQFGLRNSNVVRMYQMIQKEHHNPEDLDVFRNDGEPVSQLLFYDPGLGTFSIKPVVSGFSQWFYKVLGMAVGAGLTQNILDGYAFVVNNYEPGDRIYMFGFSRGAYTARALAGMILKVGIMERGSDHLWPYAADMYKALPRQLDKHKKNKKGKHPDRLMGEFYQTYSIKPPGEHFPIHFLGLWDTVKSVGGLINPFRLTYTRKNGYVRFVRHALAIDERRGFFRPNTWENEPRKEGQDYKQVWFAGDHSDVGGGHGDHIGLSQIALEWMYVEAKKAGLRFNAKRVAEMFEQNPPDYQSPVHPYPRWYWPTEFIPKQEHTEKDGWDYVWRMNLGRPRQLDEEIETVVLHESVIDRLKDQSTGYKPKNLPRDVVDHFTRMDGAFAGQNGVKYSIEKQVTWQEGLAAREREMDGRDQPAVETPEG